jgi:hypothetical protein
VLLPSGPSAHILLANCSGRVRAMAAAYADRHAPADIAIECERLIDGGDSLLSMPLKGHAMAENSHALLQRRPALRDRFRFRPEVETPQFTHSKTLKSLNRHSRLSGRLAAIEDTPPASAVEIGPADAGTSTALAGAWVQAEARAAVRTRVHGVHAAWHAEGDEAARPAAHEAEDARHRPREAARLRHAAGRGRVRGWEQDRARD